MKSMKSISMKNCALQIIEKMKRNNKNKIRNTSIHGTNCLTAEAV